MAESINHKKSFVVDASFVLSYLLPDERSAKSEKIFEGYEDKSIKLVSIWLLPFEVINSLTSAVKSKRVNLETARILIDAFLKLSIPLNPVDFQDCFNLSQKTGLTVYEASYLALAQSKHVSVLTLDNKLKKFV